MKIAKKSLSIFLALLMIFSACSAGLTGIVASAAEGDSEYSKQEVADLINAATAGGFTLSSGGDKWEYTADDGKALAAARAIFDYAVNTYRDSGEANSAYNSSKGLYDKFNADFSSMYTNATAAKKLVENVLNPAGTTVYSYEAPGTKTGITGAKSETEMSVGSDVSGTYPVASYPSYYASSNTGTITKNVYIQINMDDYLATFAKIEDIPSTIITSVKYTYNHTYSTSAKVTKVDTSTEGSGCSAKTYYTPVISTSYWNYMTAKPTKAETKDKTVRKALLALEKYFNEDRLAITVEDMLAMSVEDIKSLYLTTEAMYATIFTDETMTTKKFSDATLAHFGFAPAKIHKFMEDVDFAYRVVAGKYNIDILNTLIGTEYNVESYAEMSELYAKTNTAYNVVYNMDAEIINYIVGEGGYSEQYESAMALKATAESYNAVLFDIMTEQKLEETVAAMLATYSEYINVLNKEDIENPSDAEVIGLVQKVEAFDAIIDSYKGYSYFRTYWTTDYESEWARFSGILDEVYEVRGLKMEFETYYDYFLPLIYTTQIDTLDNEDAIALHADLDTKISELRTSYTEVANKWGYTIADKIFTVAYEGSDYLLQTLVENVKSTGKEAVKTVLIARTEAQLDAVYAYKDTQVVNFENFASIKSTLTYFDYDLYDYVSGQKWLSNDYTNKYSMIQTLLDRYHAFSTSDGKAYFNEGFTFADENGIYADRGAYTNDIARGEDDNYVVTEEVLEDTIVKIDNFITSRDFGALVGFTDVDDEETYVDLNTYISQMLEGMLYNDAMMNTLVGAIFPMLCEMIQAELVGALGSMDGARLDEHGVPWLNLASLVTDVSVTGELALYLDKARVKNNPEHDQKSFMEVFHDIGLNIYPATLAKSLMMSNAVSFGIGTPIYEALMAAGDDWTKLVCADDPETTLIDETKALDFEWGVYDQDTFIETMGSILDAILPLLQAVLTDKKFSGTSDNALIAYTDKITAIYIINAKNTYIRGELTINIDPLNAWSTLITPIFNALGVEKIPNVNANSTGFDIADALIGTLLKRVDQILDAPLSSILDILPNLVYFLSMDTIQEMINTLNIQIKLNLTDMDLYAGDGLGAKLLDWLKDTVMDLIAFDVPLKIADLIDLYDMLGFEISDFNEILDFVIPMLGVEGLELPPIRQQDIIFCSDWTTRSDGSVNLVANEADLIFWLLNYVVSALVPDENGNSLLTALLGSDMDPMLSGVIEKVVSNLTNNPTDAFAAIIELLNPTTYELEEMDWVDGTYNYKDIEGADQMSIVYLNYGNDWTKAHSQHLVDNAVAIVDEILAMTGSEAVDHGAELQKLLEGLFTNANITALVEMLGGFGDSPSAIIADIVTEQVGINIDSWFVAFGYLYPAETWAEDAEIIPYGHRNYVNNFGVEGTKNEDGTITWSFGKKALVDGDGYTFVNILAKLLGEASVVLEFLFAGEDVSVFNNLVTLKGYETYASSLGLLLQMLGVENLPTQADFNNDTMGAFTNMLTAVLDWFYALTSAEDMIAQVIELLPNIFYFIESNGLSTFLYNLLMPVLVIVDTVRPLIDVDVNGVLSLLTSEGLNYYAVDFNKILEYAIHGIYMNEDLDFEWYDVDVMNLTFTNILQLADKFFDTNFEASGLNQIGIKGYCSGLEKLDTPVGTVYKSTVDAADTLTILLSAVIDCLGQPAQTEGRTNGDELFAFITEVTGNEDIEKYYAAIIDLIQGVDVEYTSPDWGYMFENKDLFSVELPEHSIVYLGYSNNWTKETADAVYDSLEDIVAMVLDSALEGESIATLLNGILEDKVYTDEILNTVVELLVNLIAALDVTLRDTVDIVLDTDIATWFSFCTYNEETGKYECTKDWGIDRTTRESGKKTKFVNAIKEVLAPANQLLAFLFFGGSYEFFTASKGNSLITINGGEGYAKGLVPILEALGCTMKPADAYYANGRYDVPAAVADIFNALLALVDTVSDAPAEEVFKLLPNIIYFLNADGFKSSVNNLLAPVNGVLEKLTPIVDVSIAGLVKDAIGLDISDLTTDTLLAFAGEYGFVMSDKLVNLIKTFYIGKLVEFESANGEAAYRMAYTDKESASDMLTIVLSLVVDLFKQNETLLSDLLGADTYKAIAKVLNLTGPKPMQEFDWLYTEYANTDKVFTPVETTEIYTATYNEYWTKDKAQYLADNAEDLILNVLHMMDLKIGDTKIGDIETLINTLLSDLYSQANADALLTMVKDLVAKLSELEPYGDLIKKVAKSSLGVDLTAWDNMVITVEDGNRDSFEAAIGQIFAPVVPVLEILLTGKNVSFLVDIEGEDAITLYGSEGYAYGIIPLLEALGCDAVLTPDAYKAAIAKNPANAITAIIDPLFDRIDKLAADPINGVLELLPAVIYFINSNGLDTVVKNLVNSLDTVLECLEPLVGVTSVVDLLGIDLATYNFDYLFGLIVDMAADAGFEIEVFAGNAINELTTGRVVTYQSKNGETYYTMQYASDRDKADMVTVIFRMIVEFIIDENNYAAIKAMLAEAIADEDTYNSVCTVLDAVIAAAAEDPTRGQAMATIYYLFVTIDKTADGADSLYHDITNSWGLILHQLETSDDPLMRNLEKSIKESLNKYFGTDYVVGDKESILDEEKDAGTISFFEAIKNFFKKIGDFFRKLFGIKD